MPTRTVRTDKLVLTLPELPKEATSKLYITFHWAASTYEVTEGIREHYHFIAEKDGELVVGVPLLKNVSYKGHPRSAGYAAHVKNANTNNIAISCAAMANSYEHKARQGEYGPYPMTADQVETMIEVAAILCYTYGIQILPTRVLGHEEWDSVNGYPQDRWDINCIPHLDIRPNKRGDGTYDSMNYIRNRVKARVSELAKQQLGEGVMDGFVLPHEIVDAQRVLYGALRTLPFTNEQRAFAERALNDYNRVLHVAGLKR